MMMIRATITTLRNNNVVRMHGRAVGRALTVVQSQPHHKTSQHGILPVHARLLSSAASEELGSILTREINEETDASPEGTMPPEMKELYSEVSQNVSL